jgi:hypothetical protein
MHSDPFVFVEKQWRMPVVMWQNMSYVNVITLCCPAYVYHKIDVNGSRLLSPDNQPHAWFSNAE